MFFGLHLPIFLVVLDCEHLIVLNAKLEQLDRGFIIEWQFFFIEPSQVIFNILGETLLQCAIHFLIGLILVKAEHIVNVFNCRLPVQVLRGDRRLLEVLVVLFLQEIAVILQKFIELVHILVFLVFVGHLFYYRCNSVYLQSSIHLPT